MLAILWVICLEVNIRILKILAGRGRMNFGIRPDFGDHTGIQYLWNLRTPSQQLFPIGRLQHVRIT